MLCDVRMPTNLQEKNYDQQDFLDHNVWNYLMAFVYNIF